MQSEGRMSADVLQFTPRDLPTDGGKARHYRKRDNFKFRNLAEPIIDNRDDLMMDHADPVDLGIAPMPTGATTIAEIEWVDDGGWSPPIDAIGLEHTEIAKSIKEAEKTVLGKRVRKSPKKK